jgi:molybdate/tungstate transport system substrate-binding protein
MKSINLGGIAPRAAAGWIALAALTAVGLRAIPAGATSVPAGPVAKTASKGTVSVLFAGSLVNYMENRLGPAFQKATGYGYQGYGGGSTELAAQIRGRVREGDVFISAAASADRALEGPANGSWVSWYCTFVASPLVLAYNPNSRFGSELRHGVPWYMVLTQKGIIVGRTDPKLDPKGVLTVEAIDRASKKLHDPALAKKLGSFPVYPETALVGRLQSGQLDAGFFYAVEASSAHLSTVSLNPVYKVADYTVTILNNAANPSGGQALVRYLLDAKRSYTLTKNGLIPLKPTFSGEASAVPKSLRSVVGAS